MNNLITPNELPNWVPGKMLCASDNLDWNRVGARSYHYQAQEVEVPAMRDFMIVVYRNGTTQMHRRFENEWTQTECVPGDISLLTRSQASEWCWTDDIDVNHVYLSESLMSGVASEVMDKMVNEVFLHDVLKMQDPLISNAVNIIATEARQHQPGSSLYVEAVATQLAVHLFRNYASATFRNKDDDSGLSPILANRITEYIDSRLHEKLDLSSLAHVTGLGQWSFTRRFRVTFKQSAHAYILERRIERAKHLLQHSTKLISDIALDCGFSDQSHMTRLFQTRFKTTPAVFRRNTK